MEPIGPEVQGSSGCTGLQPVAVNYEYIQSLRALQESLELRDLLATYQADRVLEAGGRRFAFELLLAPGCQPLPLPQRLRVEGQS